MNYVKYPNEKFVETPYLPKNKLTCVVVDKRIDSVVKANLEKLGLRVVLLESDNTLDLPVSCHADMQIFHMEKDLWFFKGDVCNSNDVVNKASLIKDSCAAKRTYPEDVYCNCVNLPGFLICNKKHTHKIITDFAYNAGKEIVDVKQGYTKCSVVIVSDNAIITEDEGIYKKSTKYGIDCLLVKNKEVVLNGYNCGFIGGSAFKYDKNTLMFCGNINKHSEYSNISGFCRNYGVDLVSLSSENLYDYGTVLGVYEETR